ncbi:MAG TPA: Crp/Fnr family transcriptional regulator [Fluviicoccus sp.]|nr:Crp/Fnr family transcriptional regulator [Fluviicoccus sp.]
MSTPSLESVSNHLIAGLPRKERLRFQAQCQTVDLKFGSILCQPDQPYRHVYFPLTGFISLVTELEGHIPLEMGLIGSEGMLGMTLALGVLAAPVRAVVQGDGTALRMSAANFRLALRLSPGLMRLINRYQFVAMMQLSQSAACARFHETAPRLARWLLMTHDRAHADHFHLTHEFLAGMLGVRREGVSLAAGILQKNKLIRYTRGDIRILDRAGLEAVACECYQALLRDYARLLA